MTVLKSLINAVLVLTQLHSMRRTIIRIAVRLAEKTRQTIMTVPGSASIPSTRTKAACSARASFRHGVRCQFFSHARGFVLGGWNESCEIISHAADPISGLMLEEVCLTNEKTTWPRFPRNREQRLASTSRGLGYVELICIPLVCTIFCRWPYH